MPRNNEHNGVLLEVEWDEICWELKVERIVPVYHKTDVLGLQAFLREKLNLWAGNSSCVEEASKRYKDIIFEIIKRHVTQKIISKNPDPKHCNKDVKRIEVKVMKMYSKRNFWAALQSGTETIIQGITGSKEEDSGKVFPPALKNEGRCWT